MLSASDLTRMRATINDGVLPGTAIIYTQTTASDGMGGVTDTYTATGTVDARLDYVTAGEDTTADRTTEHTGYILTTPSTVTVEETGRIGYLGETYEVTAVLTRAPWDLCQRVELARV